MEVLIHGAVLYHKHPNNNLRYRLSIIAMLQDAFNTNPLFTSSLLTPDSGIIGCVSPLHKLGQEGYAILKPFQPRSRNIHYSPPQRTIQI